MSEYVSTIELLRRAYDDAAKHGLPGKNRALWEDVWVRCTHSSDADTDQIDFNEWLNEGPKLASKVGLYVGIKVTEAKDK